MTTDERCTKKMMMKNKTHVQKKKKKMKKDMKTKEDGREWE